MFARDPAQWAALPNFPLTRLLEQKIECQVGQKALVGLCRFGHRGGTDECRSDERREERRYEVCSPTSPGGRSIFFTSPTCFVSSEIMRRAYSSIITERPSTSSRSSR